MCLLPVIHLHSFVNVNVDVVSQTDADRRFLAAKGSVPIGIGKNTHIKRAIIDKNARIGDNVKVSSSFTIHHHLSKFGEWIFIRNTHFT